ncbi:MAG: hypothetical protein H7Y41_07655 [Hyphomonadaceae bacterium]|nr:hypothetical protein [Clostridia bacterium]
MKKWLVIALAVALISVGALAWAEPDLQNDPLVTVSYLQKIVTEINVKIANIQGSEGNAPQKFIVVDVPQGKTIIAGEGTEMILRMGAGQIIASDKGGVSDVTQGKDLTMNENMPLNHLLVVPLADGRGFTATKTVKVMMKGTYVMK